MPLVAPNLDDRLYQDIFDDARSRIPKYLPEWTDHNLSDPGITLLELFSWLSEMILYRLNQVPDANYTDRTPATAVAGQWFPAFGTRLRANSALYIGLASNNAFPGDEMNLTVRVHTNPADIQPMEAAVAALTVPPATIAWEFFDGTFWRPLAVLKDETNALTRSGHLYFRGPESAVRSIIGTIAETVYWLRCRLVNFQYE